MMTKIPKPNFTMIPNTLLGERKGYPGDMADMSEVELKVLLVVMRYTIGYHDRNARISIRKIATMAGISPVSVQTGANLLIGKGWLMKQNDLGVTKWGIVYPEEKEIEPEIVPMQLESVSKFDTVNNNSVSNFDTPNNNSVSNFDTPSNKEIRKEILNKADKNKKRFCQDDLEEPELVSADDPFEEEYGQSSLKNAKWKIPDKPLEKRLLMVCHRTKYANHEERSAVIMITKSSVSMFLTPEAKYPLEWVQFCAQFASDLNAGQPIPKMTLEGLLKYINNEEKKKKWVWSEIRKETNRRKEDGNVFKGVPEGYVEPVHDFGPSLSEMI